MLSHNSPATGESITGHHVMHRHL